MANVGKLTVDIEARLANLEKGLDKSNRLLESFKKKSITQAAAIGTAIGNAISLGIRALGQGIRDAFGFADAMGKAAQSAGVSVESYSRLAYAADLAGVSQEEMATAARRLSQNLQDAAQGTGEAVLTFKQLGINVKDNKGGLRDFESVLLETADKFSKMEDGAKKTAMATDLFGRSGARLIPLLNEGAEGVRKLMKESDEFGFTVSNRVFKASEHFNDQINRIGKSFRGLSLLIIESILPTLTFYIDKLVEMVKSSEKLEQAGRVASAGLKLIASGATIVWNIFESLTQVLGGVAAAIVALFEGRFRDAANVGKALFEDLRQNITDSVTGIYDIWDGTAERVLSSAPTLGKKLAAPADVATKEIKKQTDAWIKMIDQVYEQQEKDDQEKLKLYGLDDESKAKRAEAHAEQMRQVYEFADAWQETLDEIERQAGGVSGGITDIAKAAERNKEMARELGLTFTSAFEDAIVKGSSFRDVLRGLGEDILRILVRKQVTEPLATAIGGINFGSIFGSLFGKAAGGAVSSGTPYVVGEKGPELFVPGSSGSIVPNHAMGGGGVIVNVYEAPGTRATVREGNSMEGFTLDVLVEQVERVQERRIASGRGLAPALESRYGLSRVPGMVR